MHLTPMGFILVTWGAWGWLMLSCFLSGLAGAVAVPYIVRALDYTKRAKAARAAAVPEQAQRDIDRLYRLLAEARAREKELSKENASYRSLSRERISFDGYSDIRIHAVMHGKDA